MTNYLLSLIIFFLGVIYTNQVQATSINVSGPITTNTIWNADTVKVIGDVYINDTLTIAPGTCIEMHGFYQIYNNNKLKAIGNINDSIRFYSFDTTNLYDNNLSTGGWVGIMNNTFKSSTILSYCNIQHMKYHDGSWTTKNSGLWLLNHSIITHCTITENNLWNNNIYLPSRPGAGSSLIRVNTYAIIQFNKIIKNKSASSGTIVCSGNPYSHTQIIDQNIIAYNTSTLAAGAIRCTNAAATTITNNFICNNSTTIDPACGYYCGGGAIFLDQNSSPYIANNVIANNYSEEAGGGIKCLGANPYIVNNTIVNNLAEADNAFLSGCTGGGGICFYNSPKSPILINNIVWGNKLKGIYEQIKTSGVQNQPEVYNSCIEGGFSGFEFNPALISYTNPNAYPGIYLNNISSNPIFYNPSAGAGNNFDGLYNADWRLQNSSPCIDQGTLNNIGNLPNIDCWYNNRITGASIEIGAYEARSEFNPNGINDFENNSLLSVYPNPATNNFSIIYSPNYDNASISIINALGQIIETKQFNNSEKMSFDVSSLAKGVYFVNAIIDHKTMSSKLIIE